MYYDHFDTLRFLIILLIVVLIISIITRIAMRFRMHRLGGMWMHRRGMGMGGHHSSPALELLKERYVKGEITKEEFDAKKKDLES
jgi:uncharacterized membrane protein